MKRDILRRVAEIEYQLKEQQDSFRSACKAVSILTDRVKILESDVYVGGSQVKPRPDDSPQIPSPVGKVEKRIRRAEHEFARRTDQLEDRIQLLERLSDEDDAPELTLEQLLEGAVQSAWAGIHEPALGSQPIKAVTATEITCATCRYEGCASLFNGSCVIWEAKAKPTARDRLIAYDIIEQELHVGDQVIIPSLNHKPRTILDIRDGRLWFDGGGWMEPRASILFLRREAKG